MGCFASRSCCGCHVDKPQWYLYLYNLVNKGCSTIDGYKGAKLISSSFSVQLFCVDEAFRKGVLGKQCEVGICEMHLNSKSVITSVCKTLT